MLIASAVASLLAGFAGLAVGPTATPTPAAAAAQPIREVVYKVSIESRNESHMERENAIENPNATFTDNGTVTVDVMVKADTLLGIRVTEQMRSRGYPATFLGNVGPDGSVHFAEDALNDVSITLLRFFGTRFAAEQNLDVGTEWKQGPATQFKVKGVDGRRVSLEVTQRLNVANAISTMIIHGVILYDPGLLVPLNGDVTEHRTELHPEGAIELYRILHFERQSDTFDKPASL